MLNLSKSATRCFMRDT